MFEDDWKKLRHRFYRLGRHGPEVLVEMGYWNDTGTVGALSKETAREILFCLATDGRLDELETVISRKEAEILAKIGHVGDPCQYCGVPRDEVKPGPCPVRKRMVQEEL